MKSSRSGKDSFPRRVVKVVGENASALRFGEHGFEST
jgi:hypothetical protein